MKVCFPCLEMKTLLAVHVSQVKSTTLTYFPRVDAEAALQDSMAFHDLLTTAAAGS